MSKKKVSPEPGLRIRALREKLKLTRKEFEDLGGFKANTLRHLEAGNQAVQATTARILSNLFIHLFELTPEEASEHVILYGKKEDDPKKKQ